jgi:hypothetical protein
VWIVRTNREPCKRASPGPARDPPGTRPGPVLTHGKPRPTNAPDHTPPNPGPVRLVRSGRVRTLATAPDDAFDPLTLAPRFGSYRGGLSRIEVSRATRGPFAPLARIAHRKRWLYVAIARDPILVAFVVVRLGYAANAFAFVYHASERRFLAETKSLGPAFAASVSDTAGPGAHAAFRQGGTRFSVARDPGSASYAVRAFGGGIDLRARMDSAYAPPAISAIAPVPGNLVATTEKRALLDVTGEVTVGGQRFPLDGGLAAYDHTNGLLARRTAWRWAFALGLAKDGEPFALNLVEGHVGEAECAAWTRDDVHPLAEGRFRFDRARPLDAWSVTTADGAVDLAFSPGAVHAETRNLGIIRSRFVQPVGTFAGIVRLPGRAVELDAMLGVTEDQDVLW